MQLQSSNIKSHTVTRYMTVMKLHFSTRHKWIWWAESSKFSWFDRPYITSCFCSGVL